MTVARGTDYSGPGWRRRGLAWLGVRVYRTNVSKDGSLAGPGAELLDEVWPRPSVGWWRSVAWRWLADLEATAPWCLYGLEGREVGQSAIRGAL